MNSGWEGELARWQEEEGCGCVWEHAVRPRTRNHTGGPADLKSHHGHLSLLDLGKPPLLPGPEF